MKTLPGAFYDEPIDVLYTEPPLIEKKPACPQGFIWKGETFQIIETLEEWSDFQRRGKMSRNMRPAHLSHAALRGSWGVGRFFFRVRVEGDRFFELYYDRAPENVDDRKGKWFLFGERKLSQSNNN
jgi:hypothetical protein